MSEEPISTQNNFMPCKMFGVRKEYFDKVQNREIVLNRQIKVYNLLALMLIFLIILTSVSFIVFSLVLFQSWLVALFVGTFMGFVVFNLLKLTFITSLLPRKAHLFDMILHREKLFEPYYQQELKDVSDDEIKKIVYEEKYKVREMKNMKLRDFVSSTLFISILIRVALIVLLGFIVANGLELLIFKGQINKVLLEMKHSELFKSDYWMKNKVLSSKTPFILINSNSFFLDFKILAYGLGYWKIAIDALVIILFLLPFVVINKSKEFTEGEFVKELALSDMTIAYYCFLMTKKICENEHVKLVEQFDNNIDNLK